MFSGFCVNSVGPGFMFFMYRTPITMAVIESPGMPNTSAGIHAPASALLFADPASTTPSRCPVPNFSGVFDIRLDPAYDIHAAMSAPAPGRAWIAPAMFRSFGRRACGAEQQKRRPGGRLRRVVTGRLLGGAHHVVDGRLHVGVGERDVPALRRHRALSLDGARIERVHARLDARRPESLVPELRRARHAHRV